MFICVEGVDGSGKSTLCKHMERIFLRSGHRVYMTFEPTSSIDTHLIETLGKDEPMILMSVFTRDRIKHSEEILKHINAGEVVICDRFSLSTFAYQGSLLRENFDSDRKWLSWMENYLSIVPILPDLTIFMDVKPSVALKRLSGDSRYSLFEKQDYLEKVYDAYMKAIDASILSRDFLVCDATKNKELVRKCAMEGVREKFGIKFRA